MNSALRKIALTAALLASFGCGAREQPVDDKLKAEMAAKRQGEIDEANRQKKIAREKIEQEQRLRKQRGEQAVKEALAVQPDPALEFRPLLKPLRGKPLILDAAKKDIDYKLSYVGVDHPLWTSLDAPEITFFIVGKNKWETVGTFDAVARGDARFGVKDRVTDTITASRTLTEIHVVAWPSKTYLGSYWVKGPSPNTFSAPVDFQGKVIGGGLTGAAPDVKSWVHKFYAPPVGVERLLVLEPKDRDQAAGIVKEIFEQRPWMDPDLPIIEYLAHRLKTIEDEELRFQIIRMMKWHAVTCDPKFDPSPTTGSARAAFAANQPEWIGYWLEFARQDKAAMAKKQP